MTSRKTADDAIRRSLLAASLKGVGKSRKSNDDDDDDEERKSFHDWNKSQYWPRGAPKYAETAENEKA